MAATDTLVMPAPPVTEAVRPSKRLVSLDAFRGITIVGMILVNNPGTWAAVYPPLLHAEWHGWTPTDLIFPFFLFIVGVAIALAYTGRLARGVPKSDLVRKAFWRSVWLFGLGLMMAYFPFVTTEPSFGLRSLATLRIPGVLQRIAVCYFAASLLFLYAKPRTWYGVMVAILLGYWAAMTLIPVPGVGAGQIDAGPTTLAGYLDRLLLGAGHLWVGADRAWDPEGILSTFPAVITTLFGVWAGRLLASDREALAKAVRLFAMGVALVIVGYVWDLFFPINKPIWTSSYVVFTAGQACCALGLCYWLTDVRGYQRWAQPFVVYGVNAITVFVMSSILARALIYIEVPGEGGITSLQGAIYQNVFAPLGPPAFTSLLYALVWILGWYVVLLWMYRQKLIIKV